MADQASAREVMMTNATRKVGISGELVTAVPEQSCRGIAVKRARR